MKQATTASPDDLEAFMRTFLSTFAKLLSRVLEVDATFFSTEDPMDVDRVTLLSPTFVIAAKPLLRDDKGLLAKFLPYLAIDSTRLRTQLIKDLIDTKGSLYLSQIIQINLKEELREEAFLKKLMHLIEFAQSLGGHAAFCLARADGLQQSCADRLAEQLFGVFEAVNRQLLCSLDKQQDVLNLESRRTLLDLQAGTLGAIFHLVPSRAKDHARKIIEAEYVDLDFHLAEITIMIWKLKLTIAYMTKARMELRLQGVDTMAHQLVQFFNAHRDHPHELRVASPHQAMCFVADFMLRAKITEYLFSVESHPQLISRGTNILGFLAVTNKFSRSQAQLVWRAIKDSSDSGFVNASISIFSNLIRGLANFDERVDFIDMILSEPLPPISHTAAGFFIELLQRLREDISSYHYSTRDEDDQHYMVPLKLGLKLMRLTSPAKVQTPKHGPLYDHAAEVVGNFGSLAPSEIRKSFFKQCICSLKDSPEDGAPIAHAIHCVLKNARQMAHRELAGMRLATIFMQDFCNFVATARDAETRFSSQQLALQLTTRLDLIWLLEPEEDVEPSEQLLKRFWSHLVGSDALNNMARDVAWYRMNTIAFTVAMDTGFLERNKELLSPTKIESAFFTSGYLVFLQKRASIQVRVLGASELKDDGSINIPDVDLIWDAILRAPKSVADDNTLHYLISCYLDPSWFLRVTQGAIEQTHVSLVRNLMEKLKHAFQIIRHPRGDAVNGIDSGTGTIMTMQSVEEAELTFARIVKFLKRFLLSIRSVKDFRPQRTVTIDMTDEEQPAISRGDSLTIKCEIVRSKQAIVTRLLSAGSLDACKHLFTRICLLAAEYNVTSLQLFFGGKRCYLKEQSRLTLEDIGLPRTPHMIIREVPGADESRKDFIIPGEQWRTAFEQELVDNLDALYELLDGTDVATALTRDLLKHLPPYSKLMQSISDMKVSPSDLSALHQPFETSYSISCLREQLESGNVDATFLKYGSKLLESVLPSEEQLAQETNLIPEILADTVSCLYDSFLLARGRVPDLFEDAITVHRRLIMICDLASPHCHPSTLLWDSFEFSIDLLSFSQAVWNEYADSTRAANIHEKLLLSHPERHVRRHVAQLLKRKLAQWQPSTGVSFEMYVRYLWKVVSAFIPCAVQCPERAAETFDVALAAYKSLLDLEQITATESKESAQTWSDLLQAYQHHEQVGRDEPDAVLRGLGSLLSYTVESFPQALSLGERTKLMETIWWKHLFQKTPITHAEVMLAESDLPALETETRMDLVRLITALAIKEDEVDLMASLLGDVHLGSVDRQIDRSAMLRSAAGYVGLKNLGQTCYMNSLVTQLFMNPVFRDFILNCAPETRRTASPLLHETQRLFAIMQNSLHLCANATDFTKAILTLTDERIDVREQMDADEFMNTLFHRWEEQMPTNFLKERLRSVYTGRIVQQIKSKECDHVSEREDSCLAITCDVQGNTNLEESLKAYTQGDVMEGGECLYEFWDSNDD